MFIFVKTSFRYFDIFSRSIYLKSSYQKYILKCYSGESVLDCVENPALGPLLDHVSCRNNFQVFVRPFEVSQLAVSSSRCLDFPTCPGKGADILLRRSGVKDNDMIDCEVCTYFYMKIHARSTSTSTAPFSNPELPYVLAYRNKSCENKILPPLSTDWRADLSGSIP